MRPARTKWVMLLLLAALMVSPLGLLAACGRQGDLYLPTQTD